MTIGVVENFMHESHPEQDAERMFGPLAQGETVERFADRETMAHIMHRAGLFSSIKDARRNGWDRRVPEGWSVQTVGKRKRRIYIWNKFTESNADDARERITHHAGLQFAQQVLNTSRLRDFIQGDSK